MNRQEDGCRMTENFSERIESALNDIKNMQALFRKRYGEECLADKEIGEVLKIARAEHEEIQRYQAIGTVEEIEGLNFSSNQLRLAKLVEEYKEKLKEYEAIGTVMECREAGERQKAKKPLLHKDTNRADCPVCGGTVRGIDRPFGNWCSHCGQAIDWSE